LWEKALTASDPGRQSTRSEGTEVTEEEISAASLYSRWHLWFILGSYQNPRWGEDLLQFRPAAINRHAASPRRPPRARR